MKLQPSKAKQIEREILENAITRDRVAGSGKAIPREWLAKEIKAFRNRGFSNGAILDAVMFLNMRNEIA